MSQASASVPRYCSSLLFHMVVSLFEWDDYHVNMQRDGKKIPLRPLVKAAIVKTVYTNVLTVFFAFYFKLSWADFITLRRHPDRLFFLLRMAQTLEKGVKPYPLSTESGEDHIQESQPTSPRHLNTVVKDDAAPEQKRCSRFALYLSSRGEAVLQAMIKNAANSGELVTALQKAETFTAQGTVLRIWHGSYWDSPIIPVLREFLGKAPGEDYKSIVAHPEGDATETGHFYGPLRLMSLQDFDYDLSDADGADWLCLNCSERAQGVTDHGFIRDWEAVEELGKNGHPRSTQLLRHFNGEIHCKACGGNDIIDRKTGKEVNYPD